MKHCNISPSEKVAIKTLQNIQSQRLITVKEVDKGGGICIMNTDDRSLIVSREKVP